MCVSESQVKEIVHAEIHQEVEPIKKEVNSAKNWAIGLLVSLLMTMFGIGAWVGTIQNRVGNVEEEQRSFETRVDSKLERIEDLLLQLTKEINSPN